MNSKTLTGSNRSPVRTRPRLFQDLPLFTKRRVLALQALQFGPFVRGQPSLRRPSSRSAWRTQFRIHCSVGSNSRAIDDGDRPPRTSSMIRCRYSSGYGRRDFGIVHSYHHKGVSVHVHVATPVGVSRIRRKVSLPPSQFISCKIPNIFALFTRRCEGERHFECHRDLFLDEFPPGLGDKNGVFPRYFLIFVVRS